MNDQSYQADIKKQLKQKHSEDQIQQIQQDNQQNYEQQFDMDNKNQSAVLRQDNTLQQKENAFRFCTGQEEQDKDTQIASNNKNNIEKVESQQQNEEAFLEEYLSIPVEKKCHLIVSVNNKIMPIEDVKQQTPVQQNSHQQQFVPQIQNKNTQSLIQHTYKETKLIKEQQQKQQQTQKLSYQTQKQKENQLNYQSDQQCNGELFQSVFQHNIRTVEKEKQKQISFKLQNQEQKIFYPSIIPKDKSPIYFDELQEESYKNQNQDNYKDNYKDNQTQQKHKINQPKQISIKKDKTQQLYQISREKVSKANQIIKIKQINIKQQKSEQTIIQFDFQYQNIKRNSDQLGIQQKGKTLLRKGQIKKQTTQKQNAKTFEMSQQKKENIKQIDLNAFYVSNSQNLYPSLSLHSKKQSKSRPDQLPIKIKIHSYHVQQFLKIETQVYQIIVYCNNQNYQIQRRYSDFVFLFQSIITNQLGYILYPFPTKSVESFLKIKLSLGETSQKYQIIQKRIKQLEEFVNYLIFHQDLRNSQQLGIFLVQDRQLYQKGKLRIQKYVEQYNQLENLSNANIQNLISGGFNYVKSWIGKQAQQHVKKPSTNKIMTKQDILFGERIQIVNSQIQKYKAVLQLANKLLDTQKKLSQFNDVETQFDQLLKFSTKIASGKQYCRYFHDWLENQLIDQINFVLRSLNQIQSQLIKRSDLAELAFLAQRNNEGTKKSKLKRRIQRFQTNFQVGFQDFIKNCKKQYEQKRISFKKMWEEHRQKMKKIWN